MTKIRFESDAPSDKGKTFAGKKITTVKKTSRSSRSSRSSKDKEIKDISTLYAKAPEPKQAPIPPQPKKPKSTKGQTLYATAYDIETGEKKGYVVDGKIQPTHPSTPQPKAIPKTKKIDYSTAMSSIYDTKQSERERYKQYTTKQKSFLSPSPTTQQQLKQQQFSLRQQYPIQESQTIDVGIQDISELAREPTIEERKEQQLVFRPTPIKTYDDPNKTLVGNKLDQVSDWLSDLSHEAKQRNLNQDNQLKETLYGLGSFAAYVPVATKEGVIDPLRTPLQTIEGVVVGGVGAVTQPTKTMNKIQRDAGKFGGRLQSGDPTAAAQLTTAAAAPKIPSVLIKTAAATTKPFKFIGKKEVPLSDFVHPAVVEGQTQMPRARGTQQTIKQVEQTGGEVVTFSPGKIKPDIAGESRKSALGLEDPGIYVAPKGKGTDYFLRITQPDTLSQYTFSPTKIWESIKSEFATPTITTFKTKGAVTPPRDVLNIPGFEGIKKWHGQIAGSEKVAVTKRSKVGQGEIQRQKFTVDGKLKTEMGTSEIELVVPKGQKFTQTDTGKYTRSNGKKVEIREAMLTPTKTNIKINDITPSIIKETIKGKRPPTRSPSSSYSRTTKYKSPLSNIYGLGVFSSGGSSGSSGSPSYPFPSSGGSSGSSGSPSYPFPSSGGSSGSSGSPSYPFPSSSSYGGPVPSYPFPSSSSYGGPVPSKIIAPPPPNQSNRLNWDKYLSLGQKIKGNVGFKINPIQSIVKKTNINQKLKRML